MAFARIIAAVAVIAVLSAPGLADEKRDRFKLWNNCKGMGLLVEVEHMEKFTGAYPPDKATVARAVRSRLRSARLYLGKYRKSYPAMLWVSIGTAGRGFLSHLKFYKGSIREP